MGFGPEAENPAGTPNETYQDFRGRPLPAVISFFGGVTEEDVRVEPEGLRVTLMRDRRNLRAGGLSLSVRLRGDAEITATVEILNADPPTEGFGSGVILAINQVARVGIVVRPMGEKLVRWDRFKVDGKRGMVSSSVPREAQVGKLRLKRTGTTLSFQWAPGATGVNFDEIHRCEFGTEEITLIRLIAETNQQPCGLDARFIDLRIKEPDTPASEVARPSRSIWWIGGIVGTGLLCSLGVCFLWWRRQFTRKKPATSSNSTGPARAEVTGPYVLFSCVSCSQSLKARTDLAGRRVKCTHCGQVVLVPGST